MTEIEIKKEISRKRLIEENKMIEGIGRVIEISGKRVEEERENERKRERESNRGREGTGAGGNRKRKKDIDRHRNIKRM